jgi:signal transduction histidine kinase
MYRVPGVLSASTTARAPAAPPVRSASGLPAEDRERIAQSLNDVVAGRLLPAGQDLQAALGLLGDHPASGKIRHAADEMDQAIRDIRDTISGHATAGQPPPGTS